MAYDLTESTWTVPYHGVQHRIINRRQCTIADRGPNKIEATVFGRRGSGRVVADAINSPVWFHTIEAAQAWCEETAARFRELSVREGRQLVIDYPWAIGQPPCGGDDDEVRHGGRFFRCTRAEGHDMGMSEDGREDRMRRVTTAWQAKHWRLINGRECVIQDHGPNAIAATVYGRHGSGRVHDDATHAPVRFATIEAARVWCENIAGGFAPLAKAAGRTT